MAGENVCLFFKFGYCRFLEKCRKQHYNEICEITNCDTKHCHKRHPSICRYYENFQRCKFGDFCMFKHVKRVNEMAVKVTELEVDIKALQKENQTLMDKINSLEILLKNFTSKTKTTFATNDQPFPSSTIQTLLPSTVTIPDATKTSHNFSPIPQLDGQSSFDEVNNTYEDVDDNNDCEYCYQKFDNYEDLSIHMEKRILFFCDICRVWFHFDDENDEINQPRPFTMSSEGDPLATCESCRA